MAGRSIRDTSDHDTEEDDITTSHPHPALRPLGAFEHVIDLFTTRNPVQFSLAIELASPVSTGQLTRALVRLQETHPLLAASIDRDGGRGTFRRSPAPIPLREVVGSDWCTEAAAEQTRPIDRAGSPLVRAVLLTDTSGAAGTVVVLTFSHQVTDGRGALRAAQDLLTLLGDQPLAPRPVPAAQEELLQRLPRTPRPPVDHRPDASSPRDTARLRPFDASAPGIEAVELDRGTTDRLRATARAHGATVQGALCAAAAQALSGLTRTGSVHINVPIDLRSALNLEDDVVNRFTATTVVLHPHAHGSLWPLAQDATAQLRAARDRSQESALVLASLEAVGPEEAEAAMLAATQADLEITNLGASEVCSTSAVAIWGPTMTTQVQDERVLGVVTHGGRLRLALTTHRHGEETAADIVSRLARSTRT